MGCWCETCQISGLPIVDGTPMVTIVLEKKPYEVEEGANLVYPVDWYDVKSFAIRGVYGDYGVPEDPFSISISAAWIDGPTLQGK